MDLFVLSIVLHTRYNRLWKLSKSPHMEIHDARSDVSSITNPPSAFCNVYFKQYDSVSQNSLCLPKLVERVIGRHVHQCSLLEVMDYMGQLQTGTMFFGRNLVRICRQFLQYNCTRHLREKLVMSDGGTIALDWVTNERSQLLAAHTPIVIILHGIVGDSQSEYFYDFVRTLYANGLQPVVLVARGCGGLELTSSSLFAGSKPFDLYESVHHLQERYPGRKLLAIGYSLGAAALIQYVSLCRHRRASGLSLALCVSPPWCFQSTVQPSAILAIWSLLIALPLKLHYLSHHGTLRGLSAEYKTIQPWQVALGRDVGAFDKLCYHTYHKYDRSSIAMAGEGETSKTWIVRGQRRYSSLQDYYRDTSPCGMVGDVDTPTVVFSAEDDPLCQHRFCPEPREFSDQLVVVKSKTGGHLAFPDGRYWTKGWIEDVLLDLLVSVSSVRVD